VEEADARRLAESEAERAKAETDRERIARAAADERVRRQRVFLGFAAVAIVGFVGLSAALWHNWTGAAAAQQLADEARVEAEALSGELARSAGLLGAGLAAERAARGEIDEALLMLLEAAPAFTDTDAPAALFAHFDTVLDYAARSE